MHPIIKRFPGTAFFFSGMGLAVVSVWAQVRWVTIANDWLGLGVGYDTRPLWFVIAMNIVAWLPWVTAAVVIALRITKGKQFKAVAFALGVVSPLVMALGFLFLQSPIQNAWHRQSFSSAAWIAQDKQDPMWPVRLTMVDDLLDKNLLDNKSKEDVLALLGPGSNTSYWQEWDLHYWLGPERGLIRIDSEWLVIRFNNGRVEQYAIARD